MIVDSVLAIRKGLTSSQEAGGGLEKAIKAVADGVNGTGERRENGSGEVKFE